MRAGGFPATSAQVVDIEAHSRTSLADAVRWLEAGSGHPLDVHAGRAAHGGVRHVPADPSRACAALGLLPGLHLKEGLGAEVEWVRETIGA